MVSILKPKFAYDNVFVKRKASDVYKEFISSDWYQSAVKLSGNKQLESYFRTAFLKMMRENGDIFSYKPINPKYRKYIPLAIKFDSSFKVDEGINDKNVLILDDTVATGITMSQEANLLIQTYVPKSIEFLSILSPLNNKEIK